MLIKYLQNESAVFSILWVLGEPEKQFCLEVTFEPNPSEAVMIIIIIFLKPVISQGKSEVVSARFCHGVSLLWDLCLQRVWICQIFSFRFS